MKVGFVLSQPFGESMGTDVRVKGLIRGLCSLGVEVHIITPFKEKVPLKEKNLFTHTLPSTSYSLGTANFIYRLSKKSSTSPYIFRNVLCRKSLFSKSASSLGHGIRKIANSLNLDVLQAEQPLASLACSRIHKKLSMPTLADFHNIWAEETVASGVADYADSCYQTLYKIEREIAESTDRVLVVSKEMKEYVEKSYCISNKNVSLIPNAAFAEVENAKSVSHPSKIVHIGTLHPWENVELFIQSMPFVLKEYPEAKFFLTRKGAKLKRIKNLAQSLAVSPEFFWFKDGTDFREFLRSCDIGVISSTSHIVRKMGYPAKLYDYLSMGLPVVANDIGAWTNLIRDKEVGLVVDDSPSGFAAGLLELLQNPDLIHKYGQNGINLVKNELNYYKSAELLLNVYQELA